MSTEKRPSEPLPGERSDPTVLVLTMLAQQGRYLTQRANDGWKWGFAAKGYSAAKEFPTLREAALHEAQFLLDQAKEKRKHAERTTREAEDREILAEQIRSLMGVASPSDSRPSHTQPGVSSDE